MTTTRDAFEAWKNSQDQAEPEPERTYELSENGMNDLIDSVMLQAWQAATLAERERCALVCTKRNLGDGSREDQEAVNCANAIKRRGEL